MCFILSIPISSSFRSLLLFPFYRETDPLRDRILDILGSLRCSLPFCCGFSCLLATGIGWTAYRVRGWWELGNLAAHPRAGWWLPLSGRTFLCASHAAWHITSTWNLLSFIFTLLALKVSCHPLSDSSSQGKTPLGYTRNKGTSKVAHRSGSMGGLHLTWKSDWHGNQEQFPTPLVLLEVPDTGLEASLHWGHHYMFYCPLSGSLAASNFNF